MLKTLSFLIILVMTTPAFAGKNCLALLTSNEPRATFSNNETSAAVMWLKFLDGGGNPKGFDDYLKEQGVQPWNLNLIERQDWLGRYVLTNWDRWRTVSTVQRDQALALELKKISPKHPGVPVDGGVVRLDGDVQLTQLSKGNLKRLLSQLKEMHPITSDVANDQALNRRVKAMAKDLKFHYLRSYRADTETGIFAPLASQRELQRLGLSEPGDFYSKLVDGSPSVGFNTFATGSSSEELYALGARVSGDMFRLNSRLAQDEGFVLPQIDNALELMSLFSTWDPDALTQLVRDLRFSLPGNITTIQDLNAYLEPARLASVFPDGALYQRMAALRTRLSQFALSEPDAETFLRQALIQFFLSEASRDRSSFENYVVKFSRPGGAQAILSLDLMEFLGMKGLSLRIPVATADYTIVRREAAPPPNLKHMSQKPWDSRRLDHSSMP